MADKQLTIYDSLVDTHVGLERQGPAAQIFRQRDAGDVRKHPLKAILRTASKLRRFLKGYFAVKVIFHV